jgi:predicted AlkP superfamily phosphohydrolase/phosphomutase
VTVAPSPPLLLICLNGGDARVASELMAAGRLPVFSSLRERGAAVRLDVAGDLVTESVWASLLTGRAHGEFGLLFPGFEPETMSPRFQREPDPAHEPWWLYLPDRGRGVLVLDPPDFHPHPASRADEVCGWNVLEPPHDPYFTTETVRRALASFDRPPPLRDPSRPLSRSEERAVSKAFCESAAVRGRTALALTEGRTTVCVAFHEPHAVVHNFGHHVDETHWARPSDPEPELVSRPYEAVDAALAPLVEHFRDGNVVMALALGIRPGNRAGHLLDGLLRRAGLLALRGAGLGPRGPGGELGWLTENLRRAAPAALRERLAARLPVAARHRLASRRFRDRHVWDQTKLFTLPAWTAGQVRANVVGREAAGIVLESELDGLLTLAGELILEARDADTGEPLAERVLRMQDAFPGARARQYPDLLIQWAGRRPAQRAVHPTLGTWGAELGEGHLYTEHSADALVIAAGPGVRATESEPEADPLGLAPTLLTLAGVSVPRNMPGEPWAEMIRA